MSLVASPDTSADASPVVFAEAEQHVQSLQWPLAFRGIEGQDRRRSQVDIDGIRRVHGTKYDAAIKEMVADMSRNRGFFQDFLKKNGWSIRRCLLR